MAGFEVITEVKAIGRAQIGLDALFITLVNWPSRDTVSD
jgi:hypothetical protein